MNLLDAICYPVRRSGWLMILLGALFSVILEVLQIAPGVFGLLVAVFSAGYFGAFYLDIVSTTMSGHDEMPDWPGFSSFLDDIVSPFLLLVGLVIISFAPAVAVACLLDRGATWFAGALIAAIAYGCFYFPMAVLGSQAFGTLGAALPHIVVPGVARSLPGYLVAVAALVFGFALCVAAQILSARVPYLGWLLAAAIALYSLMFQARLIGLIYRDKRDRLGWE